MSLLQQFITNLLWAVAYLILAWYLLGLWYKRYPQFREYYPDFLARHYNFLNTPYPFTLIVWVTIPSAISIYFIGEALQWVREGF